MDARRKIEFDEAVAHAAHNVQARAQPVTLDRFEPHAPDGARAGLIPDAPLLVDVRFLLAAWDFGVKRVGDADGQAVDGLHIFGRQLVAEGGVFAEVNLFTFDGLEWVAIEPHARFVGARPECHLYQAPRKFLPRLGDGELALVPCDYLVL